MVDKNIRSAAEGLASAISEGGHDALSTIGHDLQHTASHIEDATMDALSKGARAVRRESDRMVVAARDARADATRAAARTLRTHPYLSAAALVGALVALTGITLLATRSASR